MPTKTDYIPMLVAAGIAAMGFASGSETLYMKAGIAGIMIGLCIWAIMLMEERRSSGRRTSPPHSIIPDWISRVATPFLAAMILIMKFGACLGLVLAMYQRDVAAIIVCAAAVLVLGRIALSQIRESVDAVRALYKKKGYA